MAEARWTDVGAAAELSAVPVRQVTVESKTFCLTFQNGQFGAIHDRCNHVGGPLGQGTLHGEYVVCPWHGWKFHRANGLGEPGYEADHVPAYPVRVEGGRVLIDVANGTARGHGVHAPHPLSRPIVRAPGPVRVVGISTTNMDVRHPRYSTSDALLEEALGHAKTALGCPTELIRLRELSFRACEGYYSKAARACTWPCSITSMDKKDQLDRVYEAFVHGADVILVATPIRWGAASSLYFKMVERMNCVQNQETIANRTLMKNKVAGFIITGGQDNVQAVAGSMMAFFGEIGCQFPQFPFVAHSRGWSAEDMENNVREVAGSEGLKEGARALVARAVETAAALLAGAAGQGLVPGGRKGRELDAHGT